MLIEMTAADGTPLVMRRWLATEARAALFYLHGIQSHSGWLWETGPFLAERGIEVYALDRRGSGASGGPRGHLPSAGTVLDDYAAALDLVHELTDGMPVTAVGQSLGGSVLAALCATRETGLSGAIFCAPALGQQRHRHGPAGLARMRLLSGTETTPVNLKDEQYTELPRYLSFMAHDPLMLRAVTHQSRATFVALEDSYRSAVLSLPAALLLPSEDSIIHIGRTCEVMRGLAPHAAVRTFAANSHYVEFSEVRTEYWHCVQEMAIRGIEP
ncbi:alpha/beta fold hydrolase [Streptomyces sp. NPDC047117]|uniref:alpha/beta hydrolase n=1 Tax=Streptomyces sp. NPDC047117 TaxID=3155379 RepID=UPI0033C8F12F